MKVRFHVLGADSGYWNAPNGAYYKEVLKTKDDVHVFIIAPINDKSIRGYESFNYVKEETLLKIFDVLWKSPKCINQGYSPTQPRNHILVCTVKKDLT